LSKVCFPFYFYLSSTTYTHSYTLEERIQTTRQAAKQAKLAYEQAVIRRAESQREVNELLQRKSYWSDADLARFTNIVRQDHSHEQEESRAKAAVDDAESAVEREFTQLLRSILARYHEEQVWSDKIRSMSTYGSLAALGLNLLVFILAILIVEPWKRRRLAQTFEAKIEEMSVENATKLEESLKEIGGKFVEQEHLLSDILGEIVASKGMQAKAVELQEEGMKMQPNQGATAPALAGEPTVVSIPGLPIVLPQRMFELAAVGVGAFVLGSICIILTE
jgi:sensitive to high expression protein 9